MAETTDTLNAHSAKPEAAARLEPFVDEGFEVSEAAACNDSETQAAKGSKKYVDEDSKSPEYRSDEWRMKNFKVIGGAEAKIFVLVSAATY